MFRRFRRTRHILACFLLLLTLQSLVLPSIASALTSGPTQPEFTSFEPVDTTDMVNLMTGDFTYNLPLLEVPGPEGGYPLSLSYHAGIKPEEDASWVGLGWTLNPGAINRTVNGFADDEDNVLHRQNTYWPGGVTAGFGVGVSIGLAGKAGPNLSLGLSCSNDTYQGFNGAVNIGISFSPVEAWTANFSAGGIPFSLSGVTRSPFSFGLDVSLGFDGSVDAAINGSVGTKLGGYDSPYNLGGNLSLGTAGQSAGVGLSDSYTNSSLGYSLSSSGGRFSLSAGGFQSSQSSFGSGMMRVETKSMGLSIPIFKGVWLSYNQNYTRYYIDFTLDTYFYGPIYAKEAWPSNTGGVYPKYHTQNHAIDSYSLLDPKGETSESTIREDDPDRVAGGSFPAYDAYSIVGQGISGSMSPHLFEDGTLYRRKNREFKDAGEWRTLTNFFVPKPFTKPASFRMLGDFSNHFSQNVPVTKAIDWDGVTNPNITKVDVDNISQNVLPEGFNVTTQELVGSKNVQYFTIAEIRSGAATQKGFVTPQGFTYPNYYSTYGSKIGGFSITKEDGLTYHYGIPALTSGTESQTYFPHPIGGTVSRREFAQNDAYAYMWLLTAITGPDYVDRNSVNGSRTVDEQDWGYWVAFDYGNWESYFGWRNPSTGTHYDIDNKTTQYSSGANQIYYLDAIRTRTHTALFIKDGRYDGKSVIDGSNGNYSYRQIGGFLPSINRIADCRDNENNICDEQIVISGENPCRCNYTFDKMGVASVVLNLDEIVVLSNEKLKEISQSTIENSAFTSITKLKNTLSFRNTEFYTQVGMQGNFSVLTKNTIGNVLPLLRSASIKRIGLKYDYSLLPETSNSFDDHELNIQVITDLDDIGGFHRTPPIGYFNVNLKGRLTLKAIEVYGSGNNTVLPPTLFEYEIPNPKAGMAKFVGVTSEYAYTGSQKVVELETATQLEPGDIIKFAWSAPDPDVPHFDEDPEAEQGNLWLVIREQTGFTANSFRYKGLILGRLQNVTAAATQYSFVQTKNPPYRKDFYDIWGNYKADWKKGKYDKPSRAVSEVSAKNVDVWSLQRIVSPLGAELNINYESDTYNDVVLLNDVIIEGNSVTYNSTSQMIEFMSDEGQESQYKQLPASGTLNLAVFRAIGIPSPDFSTYNYDYFESKYFQNVSYSKINNVFYIQDQAAINFFTAFTGASRRKLITTHVQIKTPDVFIRHGGGIRVQSISSKSIGSTYETRYNYTNTLNNSSGFTSYEPTSMPEVYSKEDLQALINDDTDSGNRYANVKKEYLYNLYKSANYLLAISRIIPGPGVMYSSVKTSTIGDDNIIGTGTTVYKFQPFERWMVQRFVEPPVNTFNNFVDNDIDYVSVFTNGNKFAVFSDPDETHPFTFEEVNNLSDYHEEIIQRTVSFHDFTAHVGNLLSVEKYNEDGQVVAATYNSYLSNEVISGLNSPTDSLKAKMINQAISTRYRGQGIVQQTFHEVRRVDAGWGTPQYPGRYYFLVTSSMLDYPAIITHTTEIKDGIKVTTSNKAFDFFSGQPTVVETETGYGDKVLSVSTPAYRLTRGDGNKVYPSMGPKATTVGGKQLLVQEGTSVSLIQTGGMQSLIVAGSTLGGSSVLTLYQQVPPICVPGYRIRLYSTTFPQLEQFATIDWVNPTLGQIGFEQPIVNPAIDRLELPNAEVLSASVQTWGDSWTYRIRSNSSYTDETYTGVYRKKASFAWRGKATERGTYKDFVPFNWDNIPTYGSNPKIGWQYTGEITRYDQYSHALEARDLNGEYAATKMGYNNSRVIASTAGAKYDEFVHSSFEDLEGGSTQSGYFGGEISGARGQVKTSLVGETPHTGHYMLALDETFANSDFDGMHVLYDPSGFVTPGRTYRASVWVLENEASGPLQLKILGAGIGSATATPATNTIMKAGKWKLVSVDFTVPEEASNATMVVLIGGLADEKIYLDDFRFHPIDAPATGYVYDENRGLLTYTLDQDNLATRYEYDHADRLISVFRETEDRPGRPGGFRKVKEADYEYARDND